MISRAKIATLLVVTAVVLVAGTTTASPGQDRTRTADSPAAVAVQSENVSRTVAARDVAAEEVRMQNVELSNVTVEGVRIGDETGLMQRTIEKAISTNAQGFQAESVDIGNIQSARIIIENGTATVDANLTTVALEGVQANQIRFNSSQGGLADSLFTSDRLSANRTTVRGLTVDSVVIQRVAEEPATPETPTETPGQTPTETPAGSPSPSPTETPAGTPMESPTPTESPAETPAGNETETPGELL